MYCGLVTNQREQIPHIRIMIYTSTKQPQASPTRNQHLQEHTPPTTERLLVEYSHYHWKLLQKLAYDVKPNLESGCVSITTTINVQCACTELRRDHRKLLCVCDCEQASISSNGGQQHSSFHSMHVLVCSE